MMHVFDRRQIARQRMRCARAGGDHMFLMSWAMREIGDRLSFIRRKFPVCVQIGARGPAIDAPHAGIETRIVTDIAADLLTGHKNAVLCDEEFLPFADSSVDLVTSALALHTVNDLPGCLFQIRKSLRPDGLFLAAMLGGETLHELRSCLADAELEICGGVSPRIAPFADKPQAAALLQRAGFSLPVVESEIITVTYDSVFALMHDLRQMGEGNAIAARVKHLSRRDVFLRAAELYAERHVEGDGRIAASFEIIFLLGWSPHESQQKPLPRGSAKTRLADFLETDEIGTGEKP